MSNNFDIIEALWLRKEKKRRAQKIIEGAPPLTYTAKNAGNLKNYRIYGQTVDGESVGDRTENLFDYVTMSKGLTSTYINADGDEVNSGGWSVSDYIPCDGTVFTLGTKTNMGYLPAICVYDDNKHYITGAAYNGRSTITVSADQNAKYIRFSYTNSFDLSAVMLNTGSTALPYEPYGYKVPVMVNDIVTNLYLPEQIKKVGDEAEYIDYAEQKQHRVRKNLLPNAATSQTIHGVTFIVNGDGSVTCNGTADGTSSLTLNFWAASNYILCGSPLNGGWNNYMMQVYNSDLANAKYIDTGNGVNILENGTYQIRIRIASGYTCNNLTFYPMIRKADIEDDTYEPYITNTELDVTLPALPTIAGTNTLSVGTQVQPSKVMLKGKISQE